MNNQNSPPYYNPPTTNWSILGAATLLAFGILVIVGVFLPWISGSVNLFGGSFAGDISGWELTISVGAEEVPGVLFATVGASFIVIFAWLSLLLALTVGRKSMVRYLFIFSVIINLLTIGGFIWFLIDVVSENAFSIIKFGFYLSGGAAIAGFIFGIVAFIRTQFRVVNFKEVI